MNKFFVYALFFPYWQNVFAAGWNGFTGRIKWLRGPDLARGPQFEEPWIKQRWSLRTVALEKIVTLQFFVADEWNLKQTRKNISLELIKQNYL